MLRRLLNIYAYWVCGLLCSVSLSSPVEVNTNVIDLGQVPVWKSAKFNFILENKQNIPVVFEMPRFTCGCISAQLTNAKVMPEMKTTLSGQIRLDRPGKFIVRGILKLVDDDNVFIPLSVTGEAVSILDVQGKWSDTQDKYAIIDDLKDTHTRQPIIDLVIRGLSPDVTKQVGQLSNKDIKIKSRLFSLVELENHEPGHIFLQATQPLDPESYSDLLEIKLPNDFTITQSIRFRILGDYWPRQQQINLGRVHNLKTVKCDVEFAPGANVWNGIAIKAVDPKWLGSALRISKVETDGRILHISLELDPSKIAQNVIDRGYDGFISGALLLKNELNDEEVRIFLYGVLQ